MRYFVLGSFYPILRVFTLLLLFCAVTAHAERVERTINFTLGIADNRFYAEKISTLLLQDAIAIEFVKRLSEQDMTNFALLGVQADTLRAIAFCTAQPQRRLAATQDGLVTTGTWNYNQAQLLHTIASKTTQDDLLYLLQQVYLQHKKQLGTFLQLRRHMLDNTNRRTEALVVDYQTQATQLTTQQALQRACQFITLDINDTTAVAEARDAWHALHQIQPNWAIARYFLARILLHHQNEPKQALALLKPITTERTLAPYLLVYGDALMASGDSANALVAWTKALAQTPAFFATSQALAARFAQQGKRSEQITALQQAIALRPNNHQTLLTLAHLFRASDQKLYISYLEQAISARPDYLPAYTQLTETYAQNGQLDRALELATIAINIKPDDADQLISMGALYAQKGELKQALFYYQQALALDPSPGVRTRLQNYLVP